MLALDARLGVENGHNPEGKGLDFSSVREISQNQVYNARLPDIFILFRLYSRVHLEKTTGTATSVPFRVDFRRRSYLQDGLSQSWIKFHRFGGSTRAKVVKRVSRHPSLIS